MALYDLERFGPLLLNAAAEPETWPDLLDTLSQAVGGAGAALFAMDYRPRAPLVSASLDEMTDHYVNEGWNERDSRYQGADIMMRNGIFTDLDMFSADDIAASPYYQDFLGRFGRRWFAGLGFKAGNDLWCLSIQRSIAAGPFEPDEIAQIKRLWRPLSDAATLARQFEATRFTGMTDALDLMRHAAIVFDESGHIMNLNGRAATLVGGMIDTRTRSLTFTDAISRSRFTSLVASALSDALTDDTAPNAAILRDNQGRPLLFRAVKLTGFARFSFGHAGFMVLLRPQTSAGPDDLLRRYALTAAEARLAIKLAAGLSLAQAADDLGVAYQTARVHLRSIFSKTNTHRQGELIALVAKLSKQAADDAPYAFSPGSAFHY